MYNVKEISKLTAILSKKIKELNKSSDKIVEVNTEINLLENIIDVITNTPYEIDKINIEEILPIIKKYESNSYDEETIKSILSDLNIPLEIIKARKNGMSFEYDREETEIIEKFKLLVIEVEQSAKKDVELKKETISKNNLIIDKYGVIYDKIRQTEDGKDYIESEEIDLISEIINSDEWTFEEKIQVLIYINKLNTTISINKARDINKNSEGEEEIGITEEIDEELILNLFNNNGFKADEIPKNIMEAFQKTCKYSKLVEIMDYITSNSQYSFIKNKLGAKNNWKKIYQIFKFSNIEILRYLLNESKQREINLSEIFNIYGIYKRSKKLNTEEDITNQENGPKPSKDDFDEYGTFDYYMQNSATLDKFSQLLITQWNNPRINLFESAFNSNKSVLIVRPEVLKNNLEICLRYNLLEAMYEKGTMQELLSRSLSHNIDLLLEEGLYEYTCKFPSCLLYNEALIPLIIKKSREGNLKFTPNGRLKDVRAESVGANVNEIYEELEKDEERINYFFSKMPKELLKQLDENMDMDVNYEDEVTELFKEKINESYFGGNLIYNINGSIVSINRFKRNWKIIRNFNSDSISEEDKILLALTYGSRYNDVNFNNIRIEMPRKGEYK